MLYTHLIVDRSAAQTLWNKCNLSTDSTQNSERKTFDAFFKGTWGYLRDLDCQFKSVPASRDTRFLLEFNGYLPDVPEFLNELDIVPIGAEIKRFDSAPTKATAGYYVWQEEGRNATATVERIFPKQFDLTSSQNEPVVPLYAQNILVKGSSLPIAREFHNMISQGLADKFRTDTWE
jgi:hypothetical protein